MRNPIYLSGYKIIFTSGVFWYPIISVFGFNCFNCFGEIGYQKTSGEIINPINILGFLAEVSNSKMGLIIY